MRTRSTRHLCVLVAVLVVAVGCASSTAVTMADSTTPQSAPAPECHYATTIPGGELPQPQCEDRATDDPAVPQTFVPWECPTEDYPIHVVSTRWQPYFDTPESVPACGGGVLNDVGVPMPLLTPTRPAEGIAADASIGLSLLRQPGGLFWHSTIAIPAADQPAVELTTITIGDAHPEDLRVEWRADQLARSCSPSADTISVRGNEGCRAGDGYVWLEADTLYTLRLTLDLATEDAVTWIDSWAPIG